MIILGIDPGTATTGYGILEETGSNYIILAYGCIKTSAKDSKEVRLQQIHQRVLDLIYQYQVEALAIEQLFFNKNTRTAMLVGEARGVVLLAAAQAGLPVYEYTPLQVKKSLAGYGKATKDEVMTMVQLSLSLAKPPKPDDAADALACALCHLAQENLK
jgi:crossover junction endodeoxyribonuclease RuvC